MILTLSFRGLGDYQVELSGVSDEDYKAICDYFEPLVNQSGLKSREAIAQGLEFAQKRCPAANLSDLYHHVLYRRYLATKYGASPEQSWVRTSGEGFEIFLAKHYNTRLADRGLRLVPLTGGKAKANALDRLGIAERVGGSKVDILLESENSDRSRVGGFGVVGGLHAKASLAERVSDDIPASRILMEEGLLSVLSTLDVKSFPPPHGDLVNRGELGSPARPSDKRQYIEAHGDFSSCFSYNKRTAPTEGSSASGKSIFTVDPAKEVDEFESWLIESTR